MPGLTGIGGLLSPEGRLGSSGDRPLLTGIGGLVGEPVAPRAEAGEFSKGLSAGIRTTQALGHAGLAAIGSLAGADEFVERRLAEYDRLIQEAEQFAPEVARVEDIDSLGKFASFAAYHLGEQVPVIGSILLTGAAGSIAARLGASAAGRLFGAEKIAELGRKASAFGAGAGALSGATALETGGIFGEQHEAGVQLQPGIALAGGAVAGSLEALVPLGIARAFGLGPAFTKPFAEKVLSKLSDRRLVRIGQAGALAFAGEATTEALQEVVAVAAREFVDDNFDALGPETASRIINAAATGAIVGTVFGGLGGIPRQRTVGSTKHIEDVEQANRESKEIEDVSPTALPIPDDIHEESVQRTLRAQLPPGWELIVPHGRSDTDTGPAPIEPVPQEPTIQVDVLDEQGIHEVTAGERKTETLADVAKSVARVEGQRAPRVQRLIDARETLLQRRDQPGVARRIAAIDQEINDAEPAFFGTSPNLDERENQRLRELEEKDVLVGLTQKETDHMERLLAKAQGETRAARRAATDQAIEQLEQDISEGERAAKPLYSIAPSTVAGLNAVDVEISLRSSGVVAENGPMLRVVQRIADLPKPVMESILGRASSRMRGIYAEYPDGRREVYLIANNLRDMRDAANTYLHEAVGHYGFRNVLPRKVFDEIKRLVGRDLDMNRVPRVAAGLLDPKSDEAIEERIAIAAETGGDMNVLRRVAAIIRRWIRQVFPNIKITEDEVLLWVRDVRRSLGTPTTRAIGRPENPGLAYLSRMAEHEDDPKYTLRVIEALPKKTWITREQVMQAVKAIGARKAEVEIINEVLAKPEFGERFLRGDFERAVREYVVPLELRTSHKYADYGLQRLGLPAQFSPDEPWAATHLWLAPFTTSSATHFTGEDSGRLAIHTRVYMPAFSDESGVVSIVEVQSDAYQQKRRQATAEEFTAEQITGAIEAASEAITAFRRGIDVLDSIVRFARSVPDEEIGEIWDRVRANEAVLNQAGTPVYVREINGVSVLTIDNTIGNSLFEGGASVRQIHDFLSEALSETQVAQAEAVNELAQWQEIRDRAVEPQKKELTKLEKLGENLYRQAIREEVRYWAKEGLQRLRLATAATVATVEGWPHRSRRALEREIIRLERDRLMISERLTRIQVGVAPRLELQAQLRDVSQHIRSVRAFINTIPAGEEVQLLSDHVVPIFRRYKELEKFVKREYHARVVFDASGNSWLEWDLQLHHATDPVITYASDAATFAQKIKAPTEVTDAINTTWKLWRLKTLLRVLTPLQIAQKFPLEPVRRYIAVVESWWKAKAEVIADGDAVAEDWNAWSFAKDQRKRLTDALFETSAISDKKEQRIDPAPILDKHKLEPETKALFVRIDASMQKVLSRMERALKLLAARETFGNRSQAESFLNRWEGASGADRAELAMEFGLRDEVSLRLIPRMNEIEDDFNRMRNRNFFPYMRFGRYKVLAVAKANGVRYEDRVLRKGQSGLLEFFENPEDAREFIASEEIKRLEKDFTISLDQTKDKEFTFQGMPPSLYRILQGMLKDPDLGLSDAQRNSMDDRLRDAFIRLSPGNAFRKHMLKRRGVAGFSHDALRVYSSYMLSAAGHVARLEHYIDLKEAVDSVEGLKNEVKDTGRKDVLALTEIQNSLSRHMDYILNPKNDLAWIRAIGFMWYLGFNPKSAAVNLTQVPMVLYPYLASKYDDATAVREISKATVLAGKIALGKAKISRELDEDIARGTRENFLDESFATSLAGLAESKVLERLLPEQVGGPGAFGARGEAVRRLNQVSWGAAFMFRKAEMFTRRVAFISAREIALQNGASREEAFQAGKRAVQTTMFEYAKWNRPEFMRGKRSVFFLFWQFMQHLSFLSLGGEGKQTAMRIWMMLLVAAGMQGLPFAESILDLIDWSSRQVKEALGMSNPYTDLRKEIRTLVADLGANPELVMHGLSRYYGLGPIHLLELLGVPVPRTDVSASLSAGNFVPGLEELLSADRDADKKFARTIVSVAGPIAGIPYAFWRVMEDSNPDVWKRYERAMPSMAKAVSKWGRFISRGEEQFRGGGTVVTFDPHDSQQRAEIWAQLFGFSSTRLNERYELRAMQQEMKEYYSVLRAMLYEDYAHAIMSRDREGIADARRAVRQFNEAVPHPMLRLTFDDLKRSLDLRRRAADQRTRGFPNQRMFVPLFRELQREAFPQAAQ